MTSPQPPDPANPDQQPDQSSSLLPMYGQPPPYGQPPYGQPQHGQVPHSQMPYGQVPYGQVPYGQPLDYPSVRPPGYEYRPPVRTTNTLAIVGFVCSIVGLIFCAILAILGLIFSLIGLNQIRHSGQRGSGLAIAGVVIFCISFIYHLAALSLIR